jgi:hypothetical protein
MRPAFATTLVRLRKKIDRSKIKKEGHGGSHSNESSGFEFEASSPLLDINGKYPPVPIVN